MQRFRAIVLRREKPLEESRSVKLIRLELVLTPRGKLGKLWWARVLPWKWLQCIFWEAWLRKFWVLNDCVVVGACLSASFEGVLEASYKRIRLAGCQRSVGESFLYRIQRFFYHGARMDFRASAPLREFLNHGWHWWARMFSWGNFLCELGVSLAPLC